MMDFEHWKQRHKEILREAERNRLAEELRAARRLDMDSLMGG
jgi:hypothetical protein